MNKPTHIVYNVISKEGMVDIWTPIGAGWSHHSGGGMNIKFDFYPLDGKAVVLKNRRFDEMEMLTAN